MKFVLKNPRQQLCIFSVAPCQRSYACPIAQRLQTTLKSLGHTVFGTTALMEFVLKTRANSSAFSVCRSLTTKLSPSYFPRFPPSQQSSPRAISHGFLSVRVAVASVSLPSNRALPELFPTVSFPFMMSSLQSRSLPTKSPQAISHGFLSVHDVVASVSLPPNEVSPSCFPRFPFRS